MVRAIQHICEGPLPLAQVTLSFCKSQSSWDNRCRHTQSKKIRIQLAIIDLTRKHSSMETSDFDDAGLSSLSIVLTFGSLIKKIPNFKD